VRLSHRVGIIPAGRFESSNAVGNCASINRPVKALELAAAPQDVNRWSALDVETFRDR